MPSITDQQLLSEIQRLVIEPVDSGATWPSGLWTTLEILGYANQRQQRFIGASLLVGSWFRYAFTPNQSEQVLPDEWIATQQLLVEQDGRVTPLDPLSRPEADLLLPTWPQSPGRPLGYIEQEIATLSVLLVPPPASSGVLHLFGTAIGEVLDRSGVQLTVPDEFEPYLRFGILADMFGKQGRAYDAPRRDYCEQRFAEGVQLAMALVEAVTAA